MIFAAGRGLHASGYVDAKRSNGHDRFGDILWSQAAGQDHSEIRIIPNIIPRNLPRKSPAAPAEFACGAGIENDRAGMEIREADQGLKAGNWKRLFESNSGLHQLSAK